MQKRYTVLILILIYIVIKINDNNNYWILSDLFKGVHYQYSVWWQDLILQPVTWSKDQWLKVQFVGLVTSSDCKKNWTEYTLTALFQVRWITHEKHKRPFLKPPYSVLYKHGSTDSVRPTLFVETTILIFRCLYTYIQYANILTNIIFHFCYGDSYILHPGPFCVPHFVRALTEKSTQLFFSVSIHISCFPT